MKNRYFNTSAIVLNHTFYCPYCGKKLQEYEELAGQFDKFHYYNCDCPDAEREHELKIQIRNYENEIVSLKNKMPKPKYKLQEQLVQIPAL